jgi:hypothetical protein
VEPIQIIKRTMVSGRKRENIGGGREIKLHYIPPSLYIVLRGIDLVPKLFGGRSGGSELWCGHSRFIWGLLGRRVMVWAGRHSQRWYMRRRGKGQSMGATCGDGVRRHDDRRNLMDDWLGRCLWWGSSNNLWAMWGRGHCTCRHLNWRLKWIHVKRYALDKHEIPRWCRGIWCGWGIMLSSRYKLLMCQRKHKLIKNDRTRSDNFISR